MQARRVLAAGGALTALLTLSGCDKPTPIVTVYSSGKAVHENAQSYCFSGQDPQAQPGAANACRFNQSQQPVVVQVRNGEKVLVDVDRDLAKAGWYVALRAKDGKAERLPAQDQHTLSFTPNFAGPDPLFLEVRKVPSAEQLTPTLGFWQFALVPSL